MAASPVRDASGSIISGIAIFQDITDRKRIEQALLESEQTARALMNASPESALLIDAHGTALAANEITAQRLGATIHRLIGANIYELLPPQVAERRRACTDEVVQTGRPVRFEDEQLGRWYDNYVHPIFDVDGNVSRLAVFGHDITEHKQAEEQAQRLAALEERQRLARELHDSLSQALYGIGLGAHTALTWLDGDRSKVVEALDYVLSLADAGLTEMRALIFELRPESLAMEGLVRALTKQVAAVYARNRIRVKLDVCSEPDLPLETKEAIYRIAQEALYNAVRHSQAEQLGLRLDCGSENVALEVSDNGVGFDPAQSYVGHLGLLSMHERAARLGGTLEIDSAPGQGTRVRARFPSWSEASPHITQLN
jgi:PAS domain S-box-containing protein